MLRNITTVLAALMIAVAAHAQTARPQFEVVSVKRNTSGAIPLRIGPEADRFVATNVTFSLIMQFAYQPADGKPFFANQLIGMPAWSDADRYDIEAKAGGTANRLRENR